MAKTKIELTKICDWCNSPSEKLAQVKIGKKSSAVCSSCLEAFKKMECIDCGEPVTLSKFQNGRCLKCAQMVNIQAERDAEANIMDMSHIWGEPADAGELIKMPEEEFQNWIHQIYNIPKK